MQQVEQLPSLLQYVDEANYGRSCLYLVSTCAYLPPPDDVAVLQQVCGRASTVEPISMSAHTLGSDHDQCVNQPRCMYKAVPADA